MLMMNGYTSQLIAISVSLFLNKKYEKINGHNEDLAKLLPI